MLGNVGAVALRGALLASGRVEGQHARVHIGTLPPGIEAAPILIATRAGVVATLRKVEVLPVPVGLIGPNARTTDSRHQQAGDLQRRVPDLFCLDTPASLTGQISVVGITSQELTRSAGGLPIGPAGDHQADEVFHIPTALAELRGQPIEQFRIPRRFALGTKVVDHLGEAGAEELAPVAINHHPRSQRVLGRNQPVGQVQAVQSPIGGRLGGWPEVGRDGRFHDLARFDQPIATGQHPDGPGLFRALGDERARKGTLEVGTGLVGGGPLRAEVCQFRGDRLKLEPQLGRLLGRPSGRIHLQTLRQICVGQWNRGRHDRRRVGGHPDTKTPQRVVSMSVLLLQLDL